MREIGREMEKERDVAGLTLVDTEKEAREGSDEGNGRKDGEKEGKKHRGNDTPSPSLCDAVRNQAKLGTNNIRH